MVVKYSDNKPLKDDLAFISVFSESQQAETIVGLAGRGPQQLG
jgi:hypothetical protein